jgi:hypothetical protein
VVSYLVFEGIFVCFAHSSKSEATARWCFCSAINRCGANFADTWLVPIYLLEIAWHDPKEIHSFSLTSQMVSVYSVLAKSHTFAVTSFLLSGVHPEHFNAFCRYAPFPKAADPIKNLCTANSPF